MKHAMRWVVVLLITGLAAVAWAIYAGSVAPRFFGPRLVSQDTAGRLWLVVDHALYITDQSGHILKKKDLSKLDGGMPVNGLAPLPSSPERPGMLLAVIGQPDWWRMEDDRIVDRLRPGAAGAALDEAFHVMTAPDGRIALATGGDHRVLLFDARGALVASSEPGMFRYANGGEFVAAHGDKGAWLVADTNHHRLVLLHGDTLALERSMDVSGGWLSMARLSHVPGRFSVALMDANMDTGHVVDIDGEGNPAVVYRLPAGGKPRGLIWIDDILLVADAGSYAFQAFSKHGVPLGAWGSKELRDVLAAGRADARWWHDATSLGQALAIVLLLSAVSLYFVAKRGGETHPNQAPLNLSYLGTPALGTADFLWTAARVHAPMLLLVLLPALLAGGALNVSSRPEASLAGLDTHVIALACVALLLALLVAWPVVYARRLGARPEHEAYLSFAAVRALRADKSIAQALEPGETVREVLSTWRAQLILLTDRRVLVFRRSLGGYVPVAIFTRGALRAEARAPRYSLGLHGLRLKGLTRDQIYPVKSAHTARRMADLINMSPPRAESVKAKAKRVAPLPSRSLSFPADTVYILLSILLPGLAQWLQNRFSQALLLLAISLTLYAWGLGPILLGLWGHHYDVSTFDIGIFLMLLLMVIGAAIHDALMYARYRRDLGATTAEGA